MTVPTGTTKLDKCARLEYAYRKLYRSKSRRRYERAAEFKHENLSVLYGEQS